MTPNNTDIDSDPLNKKSPEGDSLHSLSLNTLDYSTIFDTLKDHALRLVANASSEMSEKQWGDYVNEITEMYANAITAHLNKATADAYMRGKIDEAKICEKAKRHALKRKERNG